MIGGCALSWGVNVTLERLKPAGHFIVRARLPSATELLIEAYTAEVCPDAIVTFALADLTCVPWKLFPFTVTAQAPGARESTVTLVVPVIPSF